MDDLDDDRVITTVLAASANLNLTDLATAKSELGLGEGETRHDVWLGRGLRQISRAIANVSNRVFPPQAYQDLFWLRSRAWRDHNQRGAGAHDYEPLMLARSPLVAITSIVDFD